MSTSHHDHSERCILIIGASRGLGHAMAAEFAKRDWHTTGTVRATTARTPLHTLADANPGRIGIERLDVTRPDEIAALRDRLSDRRYDILFVNAGTANADPSQSLAQGPNDEFIRVMVTNTLSPMRVVEALQDLVAADGLIGVMTSGQGSVANNTAGGRELYRCSKAALNSAMRSYAARHPAPGRALVLMAPGWIRTELGGPDAPFGIDETIPDLVDTLLAKRGRPGLEYLDRLGRTVPW